MIRMFCNLIRTCSPSSLITKIDWFNLDRRRSKKDVSDKKHSIFSRIWMFWNNHDTTALHNSVRRDGVLFSLFSFFHNIKITRGSLLEKIMDIKKYFKKSNDKLDGRVLNSFVPCFPLLQCSQLQERWTMCKRNKITKRKDKIYPRRLKRTWLTTHGNMEIQKLGDGLQRSTQITPLKERLLEIGRCEISERIWK